MLSENNPVVLPSYDVLAEQLAVLDLSVSCSEFHGILCGYLCAGAVHDAEMYLRTLIITKDTKKVRKDALAVLYAVYEVSRRQIDSMDFEFHLLLPDEDVSLKERAHAFSEWCESFTEGMTLAGVDFNQLEDEESEEALTHFFEFAEMDYEHLDMSEENERAFFEVSEYARMAVLRLKSDIQSGQPDDKGCPFGTAH